MAVFTFNESILFRSVGWGGKMINTITNKKCSKLDEFTSIEESSNKDQITFQPSFWIVEIW